MVKCIDCAKLRAYFSVCVYCEGKTSISGLERDIYSGNCTPSFSNFECDETSELIKEPEQERECSDFEPIEEIS